MRYLFFILVLVGCGKTETSSSQKVGSGAKEILFIGDAIAYRLGSSIPSGYQVRMYAREHSGVVEENLAITQLDESILALAGPEDLIVVSVGYNEARWSHTNAGGAITAPFTQKVRSFIQKANSSGLRLYFISIPDGGNGPSPFDLYEGSKPAYLNALISAEGGSQIPSSTSGLDSLGYPSQLSVDILGRL